ncbi:hypothetical protein SAZ10_22020 [Mesorhizobium sp. BAC0120]|uniref:hypothetical protein n=1 Tax=Mesorhizobium sp. BAC0120 TaxID=3090670 RepID=UPI00298BD2E0|nr:hypothetical protein [Mesorhizobium sp. BAC0120]MDW6024433.1 hypothetical protein [Mesorhizobium sp. BAC0120]
MPAPALSDFLPDFGSRGNGRPVQAPAVRPEPVLEPLQTPAVDTSKLVAEEVAKAEAALTERLSAIYEATLQAERDNHAAERDELRQSLGSEAAALIEVRLAAMEEQLLAGTTSAVARILGGLLTDEIQKRAIDALSVKVREALRESEAVRIKVFGPQSLWEALSGLLGDRSAAIEFTERASFDLTVSIDSSLYETRLSEWSAELAGVLA